MAAAHPFGAFVSCRFKRIGCVRTIKVKNTIRIFRLQKRILRIMTGCGMKDPCRELFIELKFLTFLSLYIYQLIMFVNNNSELYITNDSIHNYNTRLKKNLHQPVTNLTRYQNGVLCKGTKMYNSLPYIYKGGVYWYKEFCKSLKNVPIWESIL